MEILKFIQEKKKEIDGVKKFLNDNVLVIDAGYVPMRGFRTQYLDGYPYFSDNYTKAIVDTKPFTAAKRSDKHLMANTFGPLAESGWAFAGQVSDTVLQGKMEWTKAKIFNSTDENAPSVCQNIYTDLKAKLPNLTLSNDYLITLLVLDADLVKKTNFDTSSSACLVATTAKSVGRHNITVTAIPNMDAILLNIEKVLSHMSPDFQEQFKLLYKANTSTGVRHDHLMGKVFNSVTDLGISGVEVKMVAHPEHVTHSNLLFDYELNTFPSGTWEFEVSKVGYHTLVVTLTIGRGVTVHHDFMLVPV